MYSRSWAAALAAALLLAFAGAVPADAAFPRGQLPDGVVPLHYDLELLVDPRQDGFSGRTAIEVRLDAPSALIWLHGLGLENVEAAVESQGETVAATYSEVDPVTGVARLDLAREIAAGPATLRFAYTGRYRQGAEGLFVMQVGEDRYVFSQLQAIDARRVFPGFDEPRHKTPFDIRVTAAAGDVAVSNTAAESATPAGDGLVTHRFQTTLPLPTYLLAFAVGPLDVVEAPPLPPNRLRDRPLPLRGIATRGQGPRLAFALANTAFMVEGMEQYFDQPFPYPKLDLIASPQLGGAMENAGAIIYDEAILLVEAGSPPAVLRGFAEIHAHELAHQWFGDLVTPAWWNDTWLNESFATWMGYKFAAAWRPDLMRPIELVRDAFGAMALDSLSAGRPIHQPVTDSRQISATFDSITYEKGGGVLSMFESYLGEDRFRQGVRLHIARHPHGTATSQDFFEAMAAAAGDEAVVDAFRSFVDQPGVPLVAAALTADGSLLELSQARYLPLGSTLDPAQTWKIPVCITAYGPAEPVKRCTLLTRETGSLALPAGTTAVMPNAGGAGYYRFALDPAALERLLDIADELPDTEALALVDSIAAAFRAGRLPFTDLLAAARRMAAHPTRLAALGLGNEIADLRERWTGEDQRAALAAVLTEMYAPRLAELGLELRAGAYAGEDTERRLLRRSLADRLALDADHLPTLDALADAARRSLDDPAALDPEFRALAWSVGLRRSGAAFAAAMTERVRTSPDSQLRNDAARALGRAEDPAIAAGALALAIEPGVRINEMLTITFQQMGNPRTRESAWDWLTQNFDRLNHKLPGFSQDVTYMLPASFCDAEGRRKVAEYMVPAAAAARTGSLQIARTLERIDLCVAQKAALGGQLEEAWPAAGRAD